MIVLIVAPPDFAAREFDVPPQIRTARRREQLRQVRGFENHPADARPGTTPGEVQRVKMFAQRLEVDTQIAIARVGVEFDVIAVTIARIAGQRHRTPLRIDHRHHEVHRQSVLMCFVRLERPTLRESRFAIDEGLRRRVLCERGVRGRDRTSDVSLVLFDMDFFKKINDTYGHATGDWVLKTVCATVKAQLHKSAMLGRLGGEEFALCLPNCQEEEARALAERCRAAVAAINTLPSGFDFFITASFGLVTRGAYQTDTFEETLVYADKALYRSKNEGRNRVTVYQPADVLQT